MDAVGYVKKFHYLVSRPARPKSFSCPTFLSMLLLPLLLFWARKPMHFPSNVRLILAAIAGPCMIAIPLAVLLDQRSNSVFAADGVAPPGLKATDIRATPGTSKRQHQDFIVREGTRIPPTPGHIVKIGSRWAFTPLTAEDLRQSATEGLGAPSAKEAELLATLMEKKPAMALPQMLLIENLTLQRIVTAVRADSADRLWEVTGEVTEYTGENRLMLRTAQRATAR